MTLKILMFLLLIWNCVFIFQETAAFVIVSIGSNTTDLKLENRFVLDTVQKCKLDHKGRCRPTTNRNNDDWIWPSN